MFSKSAGSCLSHFKHLRYSSVHSKVSKRTRLNINISKGRLYATTTNAPNEGGSQDPDTYCREFVRQHDRDSFLTSQFFPKNLQHACFAVRAFCLELALIQDTVSNATIGQMRMQFWEDALQRISEDRPPRHPIALALHKTMRSTNIAPYHLRRILEARTEELNSSQHFTMDTLISHAEATASTLNYILLSVLGQSSSETLSHAASHLGVSHTLVTLLRALPYHASKGIMVIPANITAKHHVNQEEVFRHGPAASNIDDAVYEFAVTANDHLITAREMFSEAGVVRVPAEAMPVFVNAIPVQSYLQRLEVANFNAFNPKLQHRENIRLPWRIWWAHYQKSF